MSQKAIVDSSVLVKIILEKDDDLLRSLYESYEVSIPANALEETAFIIIRESVKEKFGENRFYEMKQIFEEKEIDVIRKRLLVLNKISNIWKVLEINKAVFEVAKKIMLSYKLLPNDALIVAAAKYYDIPTLFTADEDFKRVRDVKVVLI